VADGPKQAAPHQYSEFAYAAWDKRPQLKLCQLPSGFFRGQFKSQQSLLARDISLFMQIGNTPGFPLKSGRITSAGPNGVARLRCISLYFPCKSGKCARDEFAADCTHRHSVCCRRDFLHIFRSSLENSRDSAGFWRMGYRVSEPETAGSEPQGRSSPRFSLLPSWAVQVRFRLFGE
jgi:hypothetical protein